MKKQIKNIMNEKIAIHITTKSQFQKLRDIAIELKIRPLSNDNNENIKKGNFCMTFSSSGCCWCEREWYLRHGYKVIEFDDLCKDQVIVIYRKDNEVIALDKRTGKKAVAKCHPDEKFNFETGAKLAFERLTNNVTFKTLALRDHKVFPYMTKGKVYEFVNGITTWDNGCESCKYDNYDDFIKNNIFLKDVCVELKDGDDPKEILKKYDEQIKIGDIVKVIDTGETYSRYDAWRGLKGYSSHFVELKGPLVDKKYRVLNIDNHDDYAYRKLALIQDPDTTQVFIVGVKGLKKC